MKIFISHSSKNANYGRALVTLLTGIGVAHSAIVFTSDTSYGIPSGANIFDWLKSKISEKPFVIYLLSNDYYSSVACLNEMGAAWIIENEHVVMFTPDFDIDSAHFRSGALDPREMGFRFNDDDRVTAFIEQIKDRFGLSTSPIITNRKRAEFLAEIASFASLTHVVNLSSEKNNVEEKFTSIKVEATPSGTSFEPVASEKVASTTKSSPVKRYFQDLANGKLKPEELMIIYYASDTAQYKLGVGWRTGQEQERIRQWEELNDLGTLLSDCYDFAMSRLDIRKLTNVSEQTAGGNARQVELIDEMQDCLLDLPDVFYTRCDEVVNIAKETRKNIKSDAFPF